MHQDNLACMIQENRKTKNGKIMGVLEKECNNSLDNDQSSSQSEENGSVDISIKRNDRKKMEKFNFVCQSEQIQIRSLDYQQQKEEVNPNQIEQIP